MQAKCERKLTYRTVEAEEGSIVTISVTGAAGDDWHIRRGSGVLTDSRLVRVIDEKAPRGGLEPKGSV